MDHDIFRTPHDVTLTFEDRPTPTEYLGKPGMADTMSMWRVQTEGYTEGTDQLIGIVSNHRGFLDSPDTEIISSGVNTKSPEAVALGRHGNFFHWGFAASPTYLTDEAKLVLVNTLHYIARFDHQAPIARKVDGAMPRVSLLEALDRITDEGHARTVALYDDLRKDYAQRQKDVQARVDAGEEVGELDRQWLTMPALETPGRLDGIRRYVPTAPWADLGEDPVAIDAFLREHLGFFRPAGRYSLAIDEELQRFGVANDDPQLLERAVQCLKDARQDDLARTLLERYTAESFETAAEWDEWLVANRDRLFFTEVGGYRWLVDTRAANTEVVSKAPELKPTQGKPLDAQLTLEDQGNGRLLLTVHIEILDGWHAYDVVPKTAPYAPLRLELVLPEGVRLDGEWQRPATHPDPTTPGLTLYEGVLAFRCELVADPGADPTQVLCKLSYQVCDARMCLPPTTKTLTAFPQDTATKVSKPSDEAIQRLSDLDQEVTEYSRKAQAVQLGG